MHRRRSIKNTDNLHRERWMISYADFVTLLFAFFVTFYSISSVDPEKYAKLSSSLEDVFHSQGKEEKPSGDISTKKDHPGSHSVVNKKVPDGWESVSFALLGKRIDLTFDELVKQGLVTIKRDPSFIEISINSSFLFGTGETRLQEGAKNIVSKLARIFSQNPGSSIYVEGFTDDAPINTIVFPSNWELSAARASAVVRLLASEGVDPSLMAAVGYGEYQPAGDNKTAQGRSKNRRIIILISRYMYDKNQISGLQGMRAPYLEHKNLQRETKEIK